MTPGDVARLADDLDAMEKCGCGCTRLSCPHCGNELIGPIDTATLRGYDEMLAALIQIQRMGYTDVGDRIMVDEAIAKATGADNPRWTITDAGRALMASKS